MPTVASVATSIAAILSCVAGVSAQTVPATQPAETGSPSRPLRLATDEVSARQTIDAFTSIEDGQPNEPGEVQYQLESSWQTRGGTPDQFQLTPEIQWTPESPLLSNSQFTANVQLDMGVGRVDGNGDLQVGWQQRWLADGVQFPTLATLAEIRVPSGDGSAGVDARLTGVVAHDIGPGTTYFNIWASSVNGNNLDLDAGNILAPDDEHGVRRFRWGVRTGYKWRIDRDLALIAGYRYEASELLGHGDINVVELSNELHISNKLTIGPGIFAGLDRHAETPNFGVGLRILWTF